MQIMQYVPGANSDIVLREFLNTFLKKKTKLVRREFSGNGNFKFSKVLSFFFNLTIYFFIL